MANDQPRRRQCGTMLMHKRLAESDPQYRANRLAIEGFAKGFATARTLARATRPKVLKIPVVVHVLFHGAAENIDDAQVRSQIAVLNRDYRRKNTDTSNVPAPFKSAAADARVTFTLAKRDPDGKATTGVTRTHTTKTRFRDDLEDAKRTASGGMDAWPADQYLNLWTVPELFDPEQGDLLGYAQFPGGKPETDGVVILHSAFGTSGTAHDPFNLGRTATHEVGHWLNLLHIWGDDGGGCARSDEVADTPNQADHNFDCPTFPHVSCGNAPDGDMFMNYMDYVNDACMFMFTAGQVTRMRATLQGPRKSVVVSPALHAPRAAPHALMAARGAAFGDGAPELFDGVGWLAPAALPTHLRGVYEAPAPAG